MVEHAATMYGCLSQLERPPSCKDTISGDKLFVLGGEHAGNVSATSEETGGLAIALSKSG